MFDPSKYDSMESQETTTEKKFSEKIEGIIKDLDRARPLIMAECNSMEKYNKEHPTAKSYPHFEEKLGGWAKVLIGLDILKKKYEIK